MTIHRRLDARGIWKGNDRALDQFAYTYAVDCGGDNATFQRVYGWTEDALERAKDRAFANLGPSTVDSLLW